MLRTLGSVTFTGEPGEAYQEEELKAIDDGVDGQHGLPVLTQNVQAHIALQVYVWVEHLRCDNFSSSPWAEDTSKSGKGACCHASQHPRLADASAAGQAFHSSISIYVPALST